MNMPKQQVYWVLLLCSLLACRSEYLPSDFLSYANDPTNGLRTVKRVGGLEFDLLYQAPAYIIANELRTNAIAPEVFKSRREALTELQYYRLKIGVADGSENITTYGVTDVGGQQDRLYYLSYHFQDDLRLIQGRDTLRASFCHFERNYDIAPHRTFMLAFPRGQEPVDRQLLLDATELGAGPVKLKITQKAIDGIPDIKLQHQ